jgi:hypothetical protein
VPDAGKQRLELVLVLCDRPRAPVVGELEERRGSKWWSIPEVDEFGEMAPGWRALVLLDLDPPHLGAVLQIVPRHPDLLFHDSLLVEVRLTPINEKEGVGLAIVFGEIELLETWRWPVGFVFAHDLLGAGQLEDGPGVGLRGRLKGLDGLDAFGELHNGDPEVAVVGHGRNTGSSGRRCG